MTFSEFVTKSREIESEKFKGSMDLTTAEFALQRSRFEIEKLSRLIAFAGNSRLRIARKKKTIWLNRLKRIKGNLQRFENLLGKNNEEPGGRSQGLKRLKTLKAQASSSILNLISALTEFEPAAILGAI